ncbi:insulinase family protein [Calidifontibacter sp. DB0510]|uniref:Insulinase family protein n=1 Tax=Metallococcus carri TaxID=1656884 RepID=A0A967B0B2_9MICO|nr:pitrilysin family protein [Metallococcus carri]NHN56436.1 insulinase family protein [Metallococcus carri]NOP36060.1 insulinase family protein [Calidifontibacter sp. DB2511S]
MTARPIVQPPRPWAFPETVEQRLANGVVAEVIPLPGQKVVSTRLIVPVPAAAEPRAQEGVGTIVSRTMDEGTAARSAEEMAELLERNGIALSGGMTARGLVMDLEATGGHLDTAWELTREFISEPAFDSTEVNRHVRQRIAEAEHELADAGARAAVEWVRRFYTSSSRASRPLGGSPETIGTIDAEACRAFHSAYIRPEGARVVVAGDVDAADVFERLDRTIGRWDESASAATPVEVNEALSPDRGGVTFVHRPGSVQTEIQLGWQGPSRRVDGGWAPYPVLSFVLGGAPTARIDKVLREEKGYTYGMRGGFRPRVRDGVFSVSGSVRGEVTAPALELLLEILRDADGGFGADEVRGGVDFLAKTAPGRFATADAVADEVAMLRMDGLGPQWVTDYLADLQQVTPERASEAWRRYSGQQPCIVLVGDAEAYADAVRALGLTVDLR